MAKKRRSFSAEFKLDTVIEGLRGEKTIAQICREREITESLYYKWRDVFYDRAVEIFKGGRQAEERNHDLEERIADLERIIGRLTVENEILKRPGAGWIHSGGETGYEPPVKPDLPQEHSL